LSKIKECCYFSGLEIILWDNLKPKTMCSISLCVQILNKQNAHF